jgi:hypothetical protein
MRITNEVFWENFYPVIAKMFSGMQAGAATRGIH